MVKVQTDLVVAATTTRLRELYCQRSVTRQHRGAVGSQPVLVAPLHRHAVARGDDRRGVVARRDGRLVDARLVDEPTRRTRPVSAFACARRRNDVVAP